MQELRRYRACPGRFCRTSPETGRREALSRALFSDARLFFPTQLCPCAVPDKRRCQRMKAAGVPRPPKLPERFLRSVFPLRYAPSGSPPCTPLCAEMPPFPSAETPFLPPPVFRSCASLPIIPASIRVSEKNVFRKATSRIKKSKKRAEVKFNLIYININCYFNTL